MKDKLLERRDLILNGNLWQAILLLAVPVAVNDFVRAMYNLIDTFFVSNIGSMEIAAITFVGPLNMLVRSISMGLSVAGTNLIAREIGRKEYDKAKNIAMQLFTISTTIGIVVALVCFRFSKEILVAASATGSIMDISNLYFRLTVLSSPFIFINSAYVALKGANGDTLRAMNVNLVAMSIKIVLTYIFIFYFNMGIKSLALSTIVGTMFTTCYAIYDVFIKKTMMRLSLKYLKFSKKVIVSLLLIGIPIIIEKSSISFSFIVVNKYVIDFGEKVLAGYGITNRINSLFFSAVAGFGTGLAPIISQNLGAGQEKRAKDGIKKTYLMALGISLFIISIVLPLKYPLAEVFSNGDSAVLYHTVNAISVYSISVIPWAIFQVTNGIFQGTGHTKYNMLISIMRIYCFRLPLIIAFTKFTDMSEYSIWYGMLVSNILTGIFAMALYYINCKELRLIGENYLQKEGV
ncbi:MATE family efflux transporter [uncultured Ilyobacter sp.]|uniref:MATE family efflux transporter n=1 Tax=uncultured Ilyobacter sp. TaxID=544433 RepID=UPI0029F4E9C4|nr:MATE family efflux transporter [uncultured Ilyobacter sp.]